MKKKNKYQNPEFWQAIFSRFARAFIAGALSGVSLVTLTDITTWTDLGRAINVLLVSAVIGGINGVYMALDKWVRFKV